MPENINLSDERILMIFVSKMITEKTPQGLSDADKDKISRVLINQLNEQVEHALLAALPADRLARLNELLDTNGSSEEIDRVFDESGVDFDAVSKQALEEFRQDYLRHGDNAALIQRADEETAQFLAQAPDGQGHSPELDAVYAAHAEEDQAKEMQYKQAMAMAGENF